MSLRRPQEPASKLSRKWPVETLAGLSLQRQNMKLVLKFDYRNPDGRVYRNGSTSDASKDRSVHDIRMAQASDTCFGFTPSHFPHASSS